MNSNLIESLQLLFVINKETDTALIDEIVINIKDVNLNAQKKFDDPKEGICLKNVILHLKLLRLHVQTNDEDEIDEEKINEQELRTLPTLFNTKIESFEHEQIKEILFFLLELITFSKEPLSLRVLDKLVANVQEYFDHKTLWHVSFSSLHVLLYYLYNVKHKDNQMGLEQKHKLETYFDDELKLEMSGGKEETEIKIFDYLRKYIRHTDESLCKKANKLCSHLNIGLSLSKKLDIISNFSKNKQLDNLVLFYGVTGSGKSTIVNYVCGTRYEIIDDDIFKPKKGEFNKLKVSSRDNGYSETLYSETLTYKDPVDSFELNFCDTPGVGDKSINKNLTIK